VLLAPHHGGEETNARRAADGRYESGSVARATIFEYLEVFDNRVRLHSSLGFVSAVEFERTHNRTHR
jgi:transposase InsO family protein